MSGALSSHGLSRPRLGYKKFAGGTLKGAPLTMAVFARILQLGLLFTALATASVVSRNPGDFALKAVNSGGTTLGVRSPSLFIPRAFTDNP